MEQEHYEAKYSGNFSAIIYASKSFIILVPVRRQGLLAVRGRLVRRLPTWPQEVAAFVCSRAPSEVNDL